MKYSRSTVLSFERKVDMHGYKKISDFSKEWGISERRINTLCLQGRIKGAEKFGNVWAIPENAERPNVDRVKKWQI